MRSSQSENFAALVVRLQCLSTRVAAVGSLAVSLVPALLTLLLGYIASVSISVRNFVDVYFIYFAHAVVLAFCFGMACVLGCANVSRLTLPLCSLILIFLLVANFVSIVASFLLVYNSMLAF